MFNFFNQDNKPEIRSLTRPEELQTGDIVILKERRTLPPELQGQQLEVTDIGTAQYSDGTEKSVTLRSVDNKTYYMCVDQNDGDPRLSFSIKVPRKIVLTLFDEDDFAQLWDEGFARLETKTKPENIADWLADSYQQDVKDGEGYYYDRDCADESPSKHQDDDGQEFRFHECSAITDDNHALSVEVWSDGETDIFLVISTPLDVIADMLPHDNG